MGHLTQINKLFDNIEPYTFGCEIAGLGKPCSCKVTDQSGCKMSHAVPNTHVTIEAPGARGRKKAWKMDNEVSNREDVKKKLSFASNAKKRIVILTFQNIIN